MSDAGLFEQEAGGDGERIQFQEPVVLCAHGWAFGAVSAM